jgi:hypothetical protein
LFLWHLLAQFVYDVVDREILCPEGGWSLTALVSVDR